MQGGGADHRWKGELEPVLRLGVVQRIAPMLAEFRETPEQLHQLAANFEEDIFSGAQSKIDYMRRLSNRVIICQKLINLRADAYHQQQQMQMVHQMQMADTVQAIHGVNYAFAAAPQGVPAMASPSWPPFQSPNQHTTCPSSESNMWTDVRHQGPPPDMMPMFYPTLNSHPATVAPVAPSVQSSEQIMHSVYMQSHNQHPAMQLQPPTNVTRGHLASSAAQLQGQPIAWPNGSQNHFLEQNICANVQHLQPTTTHRQHCGITQHRMGTQSSQILGTNVANMNNSSSGCDNQQTAGWASGLQSPLKACEQVAVERQTNIESQPMPPAQKQITVNQQSNVHCPSPQNPARRGSAGEVDWREEMLQEIKTLKDAYYSELMEINQSYVVPKLTEEQLKSLPTEKADQHKHMLHYKSCVSDVLNFLHLEKSLETYRGELPKYQKAIEHLLSCYRETKACNAEMDTGQELKSCPRKPPPQTINSIADTGQFTGGISNQEKLPPDESIGQMSQDIVRTPYAGQKTHLNNLQKVTSPYLSNRSPGALQFLPANTVELLCMLSPIAKLGAASPSAILNSTSQSPIAKPGVVAAASPSVSVNSTLASTLDLENSGFGAAASPCESVKSASSAIAKSGNAPVTSPSDTDSSFLLHNNAAENGRSQASPTKLWTPAPQCPTQTPADQAEDLEHGRAKTLVAKKPIDRLIAAVRSSSPAMLQSADNLMKLALSDMDSVSLISIGSKCAYNIRLPSESRIFGSTATIELDKPDSTSSLYLRLKRQKTQNAKDALLDEIAATNSRLIDTLISVTSYDRADGIASCNGVTLVKLSYTAVSLSPGLKSHFEASGFQPLVVPVILLIPADYPKISPVIMDNEGDAQLRTKLNCISVAVDEAFRLALRNLQEPRSLNEMARARDSCVRRTIKEYVSRLGGAMLASNLGRCVGLIGEWTKVECTRLE